MPGAGSGSAPTRQLRAPPDLPTMLATRGGLNAEEHRDPRVLYNGSKMTAIPGSPAAGQRNAALIARVAPTSTRVLAWIGETIDEDFLRNYERTYGSDLLDALGHGEISGMSYARLLRAAMSREHRELFELLALEECLCANPTTVASRLPASLRLDKTLHTLRQNIALSLYERARELSANYPLTSVRVLQVAQQYLSVVCAHEGLSPDPPERERLATRP